MSEEVRAQTPKNSKDRVLMPNDPQINFSEERVKNGIPVMENIIEIISEDK